MHIKIFKYYSIATLLGIFVGIIGSLFMLSIKWTAHLLDNGLDYVKSIGGPVGLISAIISMVMIYSAWLLVKWISLEASGSGVQEIEGALLHNRNILWRRVLPVKFIGGILAISAKLVVGREGPTIQMGGSLGEMIGECFKLSRRRINSLIAAGSAAGLAVAFNAPLAGILFVMEEMRGGFNFSFSNFSAVAISCVMSVIMLHSIVGVEPAIPMAVFSLPSLQSLWLFFIFGIVVGFVGLIFNIVLMKSLYKSDKLSPFARDVYVILVGLLVGFLVYLRPEIVGGGYEIIEKSLTMNNSFLFLGMIFILRFIMTMVSYNTGVPGGIFAPMLALGTLLGLALAHVFQWFSTDITVHPGMFAVAGMGALFASVVRAPITGIVLVVEMTQNYSMILPLMVACLTATTVVQLAGNKPIYTQLLRRTLKLRPK